MAVDPHCFDADPDPDPAQNLPRIQIQIRGGVGQPKMCIPPGQILGTPLLAVHFCLPGSKSGLPVRILF